MRDRPKSTLEAVFQKDLIILNITKHNTLEALTELNENNRFIKPIPIDRELRLCLVYFGLCYLSLCWNVLTLAFHDRNFFVVVLFVSCLVN